MNANKGNGGQSNHHVQRELALQVARLRDVLLGALAAARIGLHGEAFNAYVSGLLERGSVDVAPDGIATRVLHDLLAHGKPVSRSEIDVQIARLTAKARAKVVLRRHALAIRLRRIPYIHPRISAFGSVVKGREAFKRQTIEHVAGSIKMRPQNLDGPKVRCKNRSACLKNPDDGQLALRIGIK